MSQNNGMMGMALGSWLVAFAAGTLAGTLLWLLGGWGFLQGAFIGLIVFLALGGLISWIMTRPLPGPGEVQINPPKPGTTAHERAGTKVPASKVKPSKPLPGQADLASRKGEWKYENKAAGESAVSGDTTRPAYLTDKPDGAADDLKKISGVGPKLEETLNELGVWHYAQVAQFTASDIAWVDERLRFKGRIERDDWVGQAKDLAKAKG